jgi:uncharacterized hydrophobic protein (TIGR00271 family)
VTPGRRTRLLAQMMHGHARDAAVYWLQLVLAMGIAIFGLVLNSTGVVIGAMLISPLMGPIVALGMGLAVGSAVIAVRSFVRTIGSVLLVVGGATLITAALPFQEVTPEIAARTAPTALDLLVATGCALAGAFTTLRPASDTATSAAGTAIAIALVPPLCVVGFGLGTGDLQVAGGASLLFVANLCAILLVAVLTFVAFGFGKAPGGTVEDARRQGEARGMIERAADRVHVVFGSRYSPVLRLAMPVLFLLLVYVPLSQALREVSWQVRTRAGVQAVLRRVPGARDAVRTNVVVERGVVRLALVVLASDERARALEREVAGEIFLRTNVRPVVQVTAVPDLEALQEVAAQARAALKAPEPEEPPPMERRIADGLRALWPGGEVGPLLTWRLLAKDGPGPAVEVAHLGSPLGAAATSMLARALGEWLHAPIAVREVAIPPDLRSAEPNPPFLLAAVMAIREAARVGDLHVCVTHVERRPSRRSRSQAPSGARELLEAALAALPAERRVVSAGPEWRVAIDTRPCAPVEAPR